MTGNRSHLYVISSHWSWIPTSDKHNGISRKIRQMHVNRSRLIKISRIVIEKTMESMCIAWENTCNLSIVKSIGCLFKYIVLFYCFKSMPIIQVAEARLSSVCCNMQSICVNSSEFRAAQNRFGQQLHQLQAVREIALANNKTWMKSHQFFPPFATSFISYHPSLSTHSYFGLRKHSWFFDDKKPRV